MRLFILSLCMFFFPFMAAAKTYHDRPDTELSQFFVEKNATYIIQYPHTQHTPIELPYGVKIDFRGGSISAPLRFDHTLLAGKVKLQGSTVSGNIRNTKFVATWLCYADGTNDDATNINAILQVSNNIVFPQGVYLLKSFHQPLYPINKPYHLGINRSNITLEGKKGAVIQTETMAGTLCVYSKPYDIANSIENIVIKGLTFHVKNEEETFDRYQEHCHTISLMGVNRFLIKDCIFDNFWGDAICLNHYNDNESTGERARNSFVNILNNQIDGYKHSNRNGISVINGEHVIIKKNTLKNCSHKNMPGAIDIEANNTAYTVNDILIEDNKIDKSMGMNAAISVVSNEHRAPAHNIEIRNNRITNSNRAFAFWIDSDDCADNIAVIGNHADKNTQPFIFSKEGKTSNWTFKDNTFLCPTNQEIGGKIKIRNLNVKNNKIKRLAWYNNMTMPMIAICPIFIALCGFTFARQRRKN